MTIKNNPADDVISIIVPCFNEESVLPAFYSAVSDAASSIEGAVCEFLFIDDGSSDRTAEILQHFTEKDERVRFLTFSRNFGKEAAMFAGLEKRKIAGCQKLPKGNREAGSAAGRGITYYPFPSALGPQL